jgi:hypothetical protein
MKISDAQLKELQATVGEVHQLHPWHRVATRDAIWHFAAAVGDDNPLWSDAEYASRSVHGSVVAPPSYFYTCDRGLARPGEADLATVRDALLPDVPSLWMRSRWSWSGRLREDQSVFSEWTLNSVTRRSDGESVRQTERFTHKDESGAVLAVEEREVLRRAPRDGAGAPGPQRPIQRSWSEEMLYKDDTARRGSAELERASLRLGDPLGKLTKGPLTLMNLVNWLAGWGSPMAYTNRLLWEYLKLHPASAVPDTILGVPEPREVHHLTGDGARGVDFARGYDFGAQRIAWMIQLLTDWGGDNALPRSLDAKLLAANPIGQVAYVTGSVTGCPQDRDDGLVEVAVSVDSAEGVKLASGVATLALANRY